MKKILLSLFWIITLWLFNFWYCVDLINPWDIFAINSTTSYSAWDDVIICAEWWWWNFDYMGNQTFFNWNPAVCIILYKYDYITVNAWWNVDIYWYNVGCPSCPSCSSCEMQLTQCEGSLSSCSDDFINLKNSYNILSWNYNICNNNLNSCQYDLNTCQNSTWSSNCLETESLLQSCNNDLWMCQSNLSSCMSGGLSGENWSALFVNSLQFPGKPIVNVLIPDYITWDYSDDENSFNLSVGSGYDVDYINSVIDINSYRPTSEDFTDVFVSGLTLIMPYIVIVLFIIFTWKLIKRIFK